jgi:hypothetical protein
MKVSLSNGRAMAQVVSRRPLTVEARVCTRVNPCGICGGQSGTGTGFSPSSSVFPCQYIIPPSLSKLISSGECVICLNKGRHPCLGLTHPTLKKSLSNHQSFCLCVLCVCVCVYVCCVCVCARVRACLPTCVPH